ncbi:MAG TPA: hypothetical protein PKJ99_06175 [Thermoanaerobaculales bacterium]|nr:hypothetical protein [Thermoanaerobaculales bacterium]HQL30025.1 hypothetical protein [Thermoanaerobaculales bacterium]
MIESTIVLLGGTGKTGRRIAQRLQALGVPVRIGSRCGEPPFDWQSPATWPAVLEGASSVYIAYSPDLAVPGAAEAIHSVAELCRREGVQRLVLIAGRGEPEAERCERIVRDAGIEWTVLRVSWFAQNFSEDHLLDPILAGRVELPAGTVGEPFVDAEDIADVAAAALTEERHGGQLYELTGPRLWTFADAISEIARASGRTIHYRDVSVEEYAASLEHAQIPPEYISLLTYVFREVLDGRNAWVADGVTRALGRPPRDFTGYVRRTAATGVWDLGCEAAAGDDAACESAA